MKTYNTIWRMRLFLKYSALCPSERPDGALYLTLFYTEDCWYSCVPIGHNKLLQKIPWLMREAGIATWLFH